MSERPPLVSVVLPSHDRAATLARAADSVLGQDFTDLELIVVDDGSTDHSAEVIAGLQRDPRVRTLRHPTNLGAGAARNSGLARAQGEFVAFQDSDDIWRQGALAATVGQLRRQSSGVGVCYGYTAKQGRWGTKLLPGRWVQPRDGDLLRQLATGNFIGLPATLTRRSLLAEVGGFDAELPTLEDWDLWLRVAALTRFCFVPAALVVSPTTATGTNRFSAATLVALDRIERKHAGLFAEDTAARAQLAYLRGIAHASLGEGAAARRHLAAATSLAPSLKNRLAAAAALFGPGAVLASVAGAKAVAYGRRLPAVGATVPAATAAQSRSKAAAARAVLPALSEPTVAVLVPTRNAGSAARTLCDALEGQTVGANELIAIDSASDDDTVSILRNCGATVLHTDPQRFRHGAARNRVARAASSDILVFVTQDVVPDPECLERLIAPLAAGVVAASYARQRPWPHAPPLERFARERNYPPEFYSVGGTAQPTAGVRSFFFSNACAAVRRDAFWEVGGFPEQVIMNEDMNLAARLLRRGHIIAYCADAVVTHSHDYSPGELFGRYFDIGVALSQSEPELRSAPTTGAGVGYLRELLLFLQASGRYDLVPRAGLETAVKWLGHFLGRRHRALPTGLKRRLSLHRSYWR